MRSRTVRVNVSGQLSGHAAMALGGWVEQTDNGSVFVAPFVDQAQLTGLLVRLSDLHLAFDHVAVETTPCTAHHNPHEGAIR